MKSKGPLQLNDYILKKAPKFNDITLRIIKEFSNTFEGFLAEYFNKCFDRFFPNELKCSEVVPVYKKKE